MRLYTEEQVKKAIELAQEGYGWDGEFYLDYVNPESILEKLTPIELPSDEELAILFHNKYEELAPKFGYVTRIETKEFNKNSANGKLMISVCSEILKILNQQEK